MLNYKNFLLEGKNFEKKVEKQKQKIRKFIKYEPIIDYIFSDFIIEPDENAENQESGLKYVIWISKLVKDSFIWNLSFNFFNVAEQFGYTDENEKVRDTYLKETKLEFNDENFKIFLNDYLKTDMEIEIFNNLIEWNWDEFKDAIYITGIRDWLLYPRDEQINLSEITSLHQAVDISEEWHNSLTSSGEVANETGEKVLEFDDGYYWIDLKKSFCSDESSSMGHCGRTGKGTLFSLRKNKKPHVTSSINKDEKIVYQMKGKGNNKPVAKYHPYIVDLLIEKSFNLFKSEYLPEEDFQITDLNKELFDKLYKSNSNLIYNTMIDNLDICKDLINKKYIKEEDFFKFISENNEKVYDMFGTEKAQLDSDYKDYLVELIGRDVFEGDIDEYFLADILEYIVDKYQ